MQKTPIQRAEEYLQKAKDILKSIPLADEEHYADAKSVKKAGRTTWKGCKELLWVISNANKNYDKESEDPDNKQAFKEFLHVFDNKMVATYESAYILSNFSMACDGISNISVCVLAIHEAEKLLNWCKNIYIQQQEAKRKDYEEWMKNHKEDKIQFRKEVARQNKELEELVISKSGMSRKEIIKFEIDNFVRSNLDLVTPEERKRFDHLIFD
jgi:hypothetical protein